MNEKRGPGRPRKVSAIEALDMVVSGEARFGPPPEPRQLSATEQIAALAERRHASNGLLVKPPQQFTLQTVHAWLKEVAEVGGWGDVEIAWHQVQDIHIKGRLLNEYERLKAVAGKRMGAIEEQAAEERRLEQIAWVKRTREANKAREIAALEAKLAVMKAG